VRLALAVLIPIAAALLQGTVAPVMAIGAAHPSLPLLVAGAWALAAGAREAVWWAFVGGVASDLLSGGSLPPVAAIGVRERGLARATPLLAAGLLVGIAALVAALIYLGILAATAQPIASVPLEAGTALVSAVYTGVLALAVYPLARLVRRATEKQGALGVW